MPECNKRTCRHVKLDHDRYMHCAELTCMNYVNKCSEHRIGAVK